jgi:glycosyltransferase involved in cell wall biosynthesis
MKILYAALDQTVPGTTGGSIHVTAVAEALAARGHTVRALVTRGRQPFPAGLVAWQALSPPLGIARLRLLRCRAVRAIAAAMRPDVVIERYFNFGGEGLLAARATGALAVLEVNAPVIDYPRSPKRLLDRALIVEPMRRWRDRLCRQADLLVTPSRAILPAAVPPGKVLQLEWGADTRRFRPGAAGPIPFERGDLRTLAIFAGAFRRWHGAGQLVEAIRRLHARGRRDIGAVLVGAGPELPAVRRAAAGLDGVIFTGALPHASLPACLAAADIGVAPFDVAAHPPLQLDFYWSPLKIFEYMAAGLPVVAPAIARLQQIVRHGCEGLLYDPADPAALADALEELAEHGRRRALGDAARRRAEAEFSWEAHCRALEAGCEAALQDRAAGRITTRRLTK